MRGKHEEGWGGTRLTSEGQRRNEAAAGVLQSYDGGDGRERWAPKWIEGGDGKP